MSIEMADYAEESLPRARETLTTPTARAFFDNQSINEKINAANKLGGAPDFSVVFTKTLLDFARTLRNTGNLIPKGDLRGLTRNEKATRMLGLRQELDRRAGNFMASMRAIEMEDTVFPEVRSSIPALIRNVDGVLVWTSGHPNYQFAKIEKSGIEKLLHDSTDDSHRSTVRETLVSRNKERDTLDELYQFGLEHLGQDMTVIVYDDSQGNFNKVGKTLEDLSDLDRSERIVDSVYVWAKTGRVSEGLIPEKEAAEVAKLPQDVREKLSTVSSFSEFVTLVEQIRKERPNHAIITLLDFDGALSDNRLMRFKQFETFSDHAKKAAIELGIVESEREAEKLERFLIETLTMKREAK